MRIEGGGTVPLHSDTNHHWYYRVRVHIPVITRPEVRFFCGDQNVHMAAGEAWVFDNWRTHRVENPTPDARVHLVADTAGTSAFWRLVLQGQPAGFERPQPNARLIPYDPAARPALRIERFNVTSVMPPSELEQLTQRSPGRPRARGQSAGICGSRGRIHHRGSRVLPRLAHDLVPARRSAGGSP